jgi:oligopeptidase B
MKQFFAKTHLLLVFVLLSLFACKPTTGPVAATQPQVVENQASLLAVEEPRAQKRPIELTEHGDTRVDEYYWLRDDTRSDPEVLAYLEAENQYFDSQMAHTEALQKTLFDEMTGRLDPDDSSVPYQQNGYWYYKRFEPGKEYAIYARRKGSMDAPEEILVDGNQRAEGHNFYQQRGIEVSDDNRYVAIAEDTTGRRINTISVLDTRSGAFLPVQIGNAGDSLAWSADGGYLFYLDKHPETLLGYRVMRHQLGSAPSGDVLVYEETDNTFYTDIFRSRSKDYIMLAHTNTDTSEVKVLDAHQPLSDFQYILPRETGHEYDVDHANGLFYIRTNWNAKNFRVMSATLEDAPDKSKWKELVPGRDEAMVQNIQAFDRWLVVDERKDGLRKVRVIALDGSTDKYLDTSDEAYVMWTSTNANTDTDVIRYGYSSFVTPEQIWEIDLASGESKLLKADRILGGYDSNQYRTAHMMVTARDGTTVPVSLAYRSETPLNGTAPALIYAYGSYGSSSDPWFDDSIISLMDRGFVYVIAHVRGGQELGRQWYENGRLMNKKNTFTDFVDVTRKLQQDGIIDPKRTFAMGGSAGGLLMGAVVNMAPELYRGVVAAVPFVDVITTMLDESIPLTTGEFKEWGNPKEKAAYDYMLSYSPYDQVAAQDYPNLMVVTGLNDSQVQYFEPAKWVARLRDRRTDDNRLIMITNMDAGHGGASGRYRSYKQTAREYAFMVDLAGIEH